MDKEGRKYNCVVFKKHTFLLHKILQTTKSDVKVLSMTREGECICVLYQRRTLFFL